MFTGQLKQLITVQAASTAQDAIGEPLPTWTDVATIWANVQDITGRQFVAGGGVQNAVQTQILVRYRADLAPSMRVIHGTDVYRIEAILSQDSRSLTLMCTRSQ